MREGRKRWKCGQEECRALVEFIDSAILATNKELAWFEETSIPHCGFHHQEWFDLMCSAHKDSFRPRGPGTKLQGLSSIPVDAILMKELRSQKKNVPA